ncbi:hypothetical protein JMG10_02010 [Nostoc ellipsosporum NOK]|nr:hypothetical protein [Nostoc ellipsosporum NOK]
MIITKLTMMPTLDQIRDELETWLPAYTFSVKTGLTGSRIIARHSNGHEATVKVKGLKVLVEAVGPGWMTRLKLGAGGAFKKFAEENYAETAEKVYHFLGREYDVTLIR